MNKAKNKMGKEQEPNRIIFFQIGLLVCILLAITSINWRSVHHSKILKAPTIESEAWDLPPVTKPDKPEKPKTKEEPKKKPKPVGPPKVSDLDSLAVDTLPLDTTSMVNLDTMTFEPDPGIGDEIPDFIRVENKPRFTGCSSVEESESLDCFLQEMTKYIQSNIKMPRLEDYEKQNGRVWVQFVIAADGSIQDVEVIRSLNKKLDNEAVRLIKALPAFIPAKQRENPVPVRFVQPIKFSYK